MPSILIVEDDPNISGLYSYILKKRGHQVVQARNSEEGLGYLSTVRPQLIILDLLMPGDNGVEFLHKAKLETDYPGTKVIVVSNVDSPEFSRQLDAYKVSDYLTKAEYTPSRIADKVEEILSGETGGVRVPPLDWIARWLRGRR